MKIEFYNIGMQKSLKLTIYCLTFCFQEMDEPPCFRPLKVCYTCSKHFAIPSTYSFIGIEYFDYVHSLLRGDVI